MNQSVIYIFHESIDFFNTLINLSFLSFMNQFFSSWINLSFLSFMNQFVCFSTWINLSMLSFMNQFVFFYMNQSICYFYLLWINLFLFLHESICHCYHSWINLVLLHDQSRHFHSTNDMISTNPPLTLANFLLDCFNENIWARHKKNGSDVRVSVIRAGREISAISSL